MLCVKLMTRGFLRMTTAVFVLAVAPQVLPAGVLDERMHHLRSGAQREWTEFPETAEGREWVLPFDAGANADEQTLRLRHRDLKQVWAVSVNGKELGKLPQDENEMVTFWSIPAGLLQRAGNELRISSTGGGESDDVLIGEAQLLDGPRAKVLSAATLDVTITNGGDASPLPC